MVTNKAEYLILTLVDLARNARDKYVLSREVAERQGIPVKYMPQLMAMLTRAGWVSSARGSGGGVRLAANPEDISLKDVIDLSGDPVAIRACVGDSPGCSRIETCPLHPVWERAQASLEASLSETSIANLAAKERS